MTPPLSRGRCRAAQELRGRAVRTWRYAALFVLLLAGHAGGAQDPARPTPPGDPETRPRGTQEPAEESRRVRATAEGFNRDDALKQALRRALEEGAGVQISAHSNVENFALIRDTIYSRASGIVSDYRIVEEGPAGDGAFRVTVEATVRPSAVARAWGEVQNVLDQIGRPKIMVWVDEYIDGQLQPDSFVENRIEKLFADVGFGLVDRRAVEEIARREAQDAERAGNAARLARLAKDAGAHILIRGTAQADQAGIEELYGVPAAFYNCSVQVKVYYTDTGRLLTTESVPVVRRGVRSRREFSPQAARAALEQATFPASPARGREPALAERLYAAVMEQWATQISAGGEIILEIERLDFRDYLRIKRALEQVERLRAVHGDFTRGTAVFRIQTTMSAENLAELLSAAPFSEWLEVVDLKPNRIQAVQTGS